MTRTAVLALVPAAAAAAPASAGVVVRKGVEYGRAAVGVPAPAGARHPLVVVIHGGGFARQSRTDPGVVRVARALAARGIVAASIDYRLRGQDPVPSRRVAPLLEELGDSRFARAVVAATDDTLTAIRHLRRNAGRLGIDKRRIGLVGSSAGAITADHVAYALDDHGIDGPRIRFAGSLWGGILVPSPVPDTAAATQLDAGEAALFAVHGDDDPTVPVAWSDLLVNRARAVGVRSEHRRIAGGRHGYAASGFFTTPVEGEQTAFDRLLRFAKARLRRR